MTNHPNDEQAARGLGNVARNPGINNELRLKLADALMTPNKAYRGMKKIPIELIWALEAIIDTIRQEKNEQVTDIRVDGQQLPDELIDLVDEYFPKGQCQERGQAMVLTAMFWQWHTKAPLKDQEGK